MQIDLIVFAGLRQVVGFKQQRLSLPDDSTVADVIAQLPPAVQSRTFYVAVNQEYAQRDTKLSAGDEVALLPPVSGGGHLPARRNPGGR